MKNFKNKQGFSTLILVIIAVVVLGGGYYIYKSQFLNTSPSSGIVKDFEDLSSGSPIGKNSPTNWSDTLCAYYTLADAQATLGSAAYLPKDGFTSNVCGYRVTGSEDKKGSMVILYRSYSSDFAKIMYDSSIKSGAKDLPGVAEFATIKTDRQGDAMISFYNKGVLGSVGVDGFETPERNIEIAISIAKKVISKLPQ